MAPPSIDNGFSSLLCAEDNKSVFNEPDFCGGGGGGEVVVAEDGFGDATWRHRHNKSRGFCGVGDGFGLPMQSEECLALMVKKQNQHLPRVDFLNRLRNGDLDLKARREAVDSILKAHCHFNFGPLCAYLSISYLDRFLSVYEVPEGRAWMMQLLSVACLSLAAKMEETEVPSSLDLQVGNAKFVFEARTIQRMELLVLSTLRWRMQAITPLSFIDHFLNKVINEENPPTSLVMQSIHLILKTIKGTDFLEFKPSEIAAAVAITVVGETRMAMDADKAISLLSQYAEKERVIKCLQLINTSLIGESVKHENGSLLSVPRSPIGVLDAACLSYRSDDSLTDGSCKFRTQHPDAKRRKLNRP